MVEKKGFSFRYAALVMKFRWFILAFSIVITVLAAWQIQYVDIRNDPDTLLPQTNKYVSTNNYIEETFGMGNIYVIGIELQEDAGSVYQPWFVNTVREIHNKLENMDGANKPNFISVAAQKVKNMGVDEDGSLIFKRLIPNDGISTTDPELAQEQLAFMKEGIDNNPVLKPMILHEVNPETGEKCINNEPNCVAKATFVIADFDNSVKEHYVEWVRQAVADLEPYYNDDRLKISIAGEPYFLAWMMVQLVDHWYLFVASVLIALLILYVETRSIKGALFPMISVGMSIVWTLGLMGFTGFKLTTMMVLTPMLILAVGMGHAIQVTRRYMKGIRDGETVELASFSALGFTIIPATLSIITDAIGFATLATVDISFYKAYAYFGMFGMFSLLITTTTLIPLMMVMFKDKQQKVLPEAYKWEIKLGDFVAKLLGGPGKFVPIGAVIVILALSVHYTKMDEGIANIVNDDRYSGIEKVVVLSQGDTYDLMPGVQKGIDYAQAAFKVQSQPVQDIFALNEIMPGVISFNIPIRAKKPLLPECGDAYFDALYAAEDAGTAPPEKNCYDPEMDKPQGIMNKAEVIGAMEKMEDDLREHPYIGFTASYAQYIKIANMLLITEPGNQPSLADFKVPTKEYLLAKNPDDDRSPDDIVSMYNGLLEMASNPGDLSSAVSQNYNNGVIMGFVNTMHPDETHAALKFIQDYIETHKNDPGFNQLNFGFRNADASGDVGEIADDTSPAYITPGVGGFLGATEATRDITFDNWILNPLGTALAIFLVVSLIFRSFIVAGMLMTILFITLFAQYGLAGYYSAQAFWSGNLHFGNLVALSIAMGLGVDYSIYMISRLREEMQEHGNWTQALRNTVATTGSSVLISVVVLIGAFIPLMATDLGNTWGLSVYITEAIVIDVFTALTILPLLILWTKPRYVFGPR
jgi:predicted RND superfamily exporter protein